MFNSAQGRIFENAHGSTSTCLLNDSSPAGPQQETPRALRAHAPAQYAAARRVVASPTLVAIQIELGMIASLDSLHQEGFPAANGFQKAAGSDVSS